LGGRRIKLIWDFRGPDAAKTAIHHEKHLREFASADGLNPEDTGHTTYSDLHSIAYLIVPETGMIRVRDRLIPHRGEYVE